MKIVLIGYRGTGKSVVGKLVAKRLQMSCISTDTTIVENAGMAIADIVENSGWTAFRDMESEVARELGKRDKIIIDTGGGIIERPENIDALQAKSHVVWLKASVDMIVSRIQGGTARPSLTGEKSFTEEVSEVLERREPMYKRAAQYEIDTDPLAPKQVADRIVDIWQRE